MLDVTCVEIVVCVIFHLCCHVTKYDVMCRLMMLEVIKYFPVDGDCVAEIEVAIQKQHS